MPPKSYRRQTAVRQPRQSRVSSRQQQQVTAKKSTCAAGSSAPRWMVYIAFGLLTVLALAIVYKTVLAPPRRSPYESFQDAAASAAPAAKKADSKIVFMYMTGCGWCEKMRPHWDSFKTTNADRLRALGVTAAAYERSDPAAAALKEHVDGYPTVLFVASDGKTVTKFEGERTPEGLLAFVEKNAAGASAPSGATREGFFFDGGSEGKAITSGIAAADSSVFKKAVDDIKARAGARFGKP